MSEEKTYKETKYPEEIKKIYKWFDTDRNAKGFIQEEFEEAYKIYNGDHWSLKDPLGMPLRSKQQKQSRPNTVENFIFSLIEGMVSEFAEDVDIIDYPMEAGDDEVANVMTNLKKYILYKNRIKQQRENYMRNFFLYGTGIWHCVWDPTWKGGRGPNKWQGDVRITSIHPQVVFPDARCRLSIEDGQRIHKAFYKTVEDIKMRYGVDVQADHTANIDILGDENEYHDGDDEEVLLVETWYKGKPMFPNDEEDKEHGNDYGMHVVWWAGDTNPTYLHHENYVYYDPEEDCKFPFIFRSRYPRENSIWGYGEAYFLKSPQVALNKTAELILEGHMHFALGQTFYRPGAISPKQEKFLRQFGTLPNMYFAVNNIEDIKRIHGKGVDPSLANETQRLQRVMEGIIGRHDISQGRTPGSVVAFRALDLLAARARIRLRSAETQIITGYEDLGNYMNHLITRFYTEERAYRILGEGTERTEYILINEMTGEEHPFLGQIPPGYTLDTRVVPTIEYGTFRPDDIKRVYVYDVQTGWEDTFPYNDEAAQAIDMVEIMKEDPDMEIDIPTEYEVFYPELDVQCKVSTSAPSDRAFYMEMAKELLMAQLIDEETFWYVIQNGKFPPYETIMNKRKKEMASVAQQEAEMAMQQAEAQQAQPQQQMDPMMGGEQIDPMMGGMEQGGDFQLTPMLEQIFAERPDLWEKFNQLPPDAKQQVAAQLMGGSQAMI